MKSAFLICLILFSIVSFAQIPSDKSQTTWDLLYKSKSKEAIGKPFPSFKAFAEETLLTNKSFKAKVVFVNFWVEECATCMAEMDTLNELYLKLKDNKNFDFISFTYEKPEKIKEIKDKFHIQYKVASI